MLRAKNYEILMPKTSILVIFGQKGPFWTVFGQNGQNGENYQKSAWNIFLALTSPNCKVSEKSNERFPRKSVADVRTDGQTRLLRSPRLVGRETKNRTIPVNQSEEKWGKPHF